MPDTLIVFGIRYGATAEVAEELARIFEDKYGLSVHVADLNKQKTKDMSSYDKDSMMENTK